MRKSTLPLCALFLSFAAANSGATNVWWDNNGVAAATNGTWDNSSLNWAPSGTLTASTFSFTNGNFPEFSSGTGTIASLTISVPGPVTAAGMADGLSGATITTLTFNGAGPITIASGLQGFYCGGSGSDSVVFNVPLTGAGELQQHSSGSIALYASNSYTGGTAVTGGQVVYYNNNNSFGTGPIVIGGSGNAFVSSATNSITITNAFSFPTTNYMVNLAGGNAVGGLPGTLFTGNFPLPSAGTTTLETSSTATTVDEISGVISGASALTISDDGTLLLAGVNTYTGGTTISSPVTVNIIGAGSLGSGTYSGTIANTGTFIYSSSASQTLSGIISGAGTFTVSGTGPVTLGAANTYTGATTIGAGSTLLLASSGNFSSTASINLAAGATLDVSAYPAAALGANTMVVASGTGTAVGSTAAAVNAQAGGTISLGSNPISLTFTPANFSGDNTHPSGYIPQGTLILTGNAYTVYNASGTALGAGSYSLIQQAGGNITSSGVSSVVVTGAGIVPGNQAIIQVSGGSVNLVVQSPPVTSNVWNGADVANSANWSDATNWISTVAPDAFGDNIVFDGTTNTMPVMDRPYTVNSLSFASAAGTFVLTNTGGGVLSVSAGVTNFSANAETISLPVALVEDGNANPSQWTIPAARGTVTVTGPVSDQGYGLVLSGGGALALDAVNTYTGPTTIGSGSTLTIGAAGKLAASGTYAGAVNNNGALNYTSTQSQTLSGLISGTGSIAFNPNSGNTLTLSHANTYTGATTILNGSLIIGSDANLGAAPASFAPNQLVLNNNVTSSGNDYGLRITTGTSFSLAANRGIFLGPLGGSINVQSSETLTVLGVISGTGPFYASPNYSAGYGTIILSAANTYTGPTIIGAGTLELGINGALPYGTPLTIGSSDQGVTGGSFFNMNSKSQTIGPLSSSTGINGLKGTGTPTLQMSGALTILQTNVSTTFGGGITGAGSLTLSVPAGGIPSTLTLTNTNNFTGATIINGGTLALAGAKASISNSSGITIAAGAILDVSGVTPGTFFLSSSSSLTASGIGSGNSSATINGPAGGTVNLGSRPVTLKYSPASSSGDLASPALYVAQGALALNGNTLTVNNISGTPMAAGTYTLISVVSGNISSNGTFAVSVTGSGLAASATSALQITNGAVNLVVTMNVPSINSITSGVGGSVVLSGAGGPPNGSFHIISSPDATLPVSQWTVVSTNTFSATGSFSVTNVPAVTPDFFMIKVP